MKTLITVYFVACAVVVGYFSARRITGRDLGFTPARKYVRSLALNLLHTEIVAAREAGAASATTTE
jgi:hypothetical protein